MRKPKGLGVPDDQNGPPVLPALTSLAATDPAATTPPGGNLSKYAVLGLALSGYPKAAEALKAFQEPEPVVTEPSVWAALTTKLGVSASGTGVGDALRSQIGEALSAHGEIAEKGLEEYYRASSP